MRQFSQSDCGIQGPVKRIFVQPERQYLNMLNYRKHLDFLTRPPLKPWMRENWICLDKNEAPFSPLRDNSSFLERLRNVDARTYPDPFPVYKKLSDFIGLPPEQILLTYGSEQAIRVCYELMVDPRDQVICLNPTFAMFEVFNKTFNADPIYVDCEFGELHADVILPHISERTKLIAISNPNNPTGSIFPLADLKKIVEAAAKVGSLLLVDEAYFHYCDVTAQPLIEDFDNLAITRTFSKAWGLAGIRVGYMMAQLDTIDKFRKLKPMDEMTTFSIAASRFALDNLEYLERNVAQVRKWRDKFGQLNGPNVSTIETEGNFILVKVNPVLKPGILQWFIDNRIFVKEGYDHPIMADSIRFSVTEDTVMEMIFQRLNSSNRN